MRHDLRARLRAMETLVGTMITLPCAAVAEVVAGSGFDWLFLDAEHGALETADLLSIMQAVDRDVPCVVRVASGDEVPIKKVLDLGAAGVIAPQINSAEHAAKIVGYARYAPRGARGVGLARAHGYGAGFAEYVGRANEDIAVIVQAEHALAVENIDRIVAVDGIDAVFLGPYDLAASLGHMGAVEAPAVVEAIEHVTKTCRAAGMPLGYFGTDAAAVAPYMQRGYTLVVAGVDTVLLAGAARKLLGNLREQRGKQ